MTTLLSKGYTSGVANISSDITTVTNWKGGTELTFTDTGGGGYCIR